MTLAIDFGSGGTAQADAEAHVDALRASSAILATGPALPRCDDLAGNAQCGSLFEECDCVSASEPALDCVCRTADAVRPFRLNDGRIVVPVTPYHVEGETVDGVDLSPSLAVEIASSLFEATGPDDSTTGPILRS